MENILYNNNIEAHLKILYAYTSSRQVFKLHKTTISCLDLSYYIELHHTQ